MSELGEVGVRQEACVLDELAITNLGVIEEATLELSPGLTVVTGETGAGKTMIVTALELLLGARADSSLVRSGATTAVVSAVVRPVPAGAASWLGDGPDDPEVAGADTGGGAATADPEDAAAPELGPELVVSELVVSRELRTGGRSSRARIGGVLAPVSALTEVLGRHVEVHAQHEHVRLARAEVQRRLLDRFAGEDHLATLHAYREAYTTWRDLLERRERRLTDARERARELDRLRSEAAEIDAAAIDPDRDAQVLGVELERLANAEDLRFAAAEAAAALGADAAGEPLGVAVSALRRLAVEDPMLTELAARAAALAAEATELAVDVRLYGEEVAADPERLAQLQERRATLQGLTRKYGVDAAAVVAYAEEARARLTALEAEDAETDLLDARIAEAEARAATLAADLRRGREATGATLATVVDGHLGDLGMPHARFGVAVEASSDGQLGADGADRVSFLLAPNPGEPARPLAQAASGGERSRVSLAVEVALADADDVEVLVFDEVDAGVGGATAMAVGDKLAQLAHGGAADRPRQVLCVTHLAQLAAFADVHHVVEKAVSGERTVTTARRVAEDERVAEVARMLGGDPSAGPALEHARELLSRARGTPHAATR